MSRVLLLSPTVEQVDQYVKQGDNCTAVIDEWNAFQDIQHRHGKRNPVVFMPVGGYVRAAECGTFDKIIGAESLVMQPYYFPHISRILRFNGKLICIHSNKVLLEKPPGFLISSYPRCGTHMVVTSLSSHPQLETYGEVFNPGCQNGTHKFKSVAQVLEGFWTNNTRVGVAAHAYIGQPNNPTRFHAPQGWYTGFWDNLPRDIQLISVRRRNLLARFVSHAKAKASNVWNAYNNDKVKTNQRVTVNVDEFKKDVAFVRSCWSRVDSLYPGRLVVFYEDMCDHWDREQQRMQEYLGVDYRQVLPSSRKLGRPLEETVTNYAEVMRRVPDKLFMLGD